MRSLVHHLSRRRYITWLGVDGRNSTLTAEDILRDPDINIPCFNRLAHSLDRKGIPYYMVEFRPVQKEENHQENSST